VSLYFKRSQEVGAQGLRPIRSQEEERRKKEERKRIILNLNKWLRFHGVKANYFDIINLESPCTY
jgi:hypothetical protein